MCACVVQIRAIRKKMTEIMTKEVGFVEMIKAVEKFVPELIGKDIMKACEGICPLQNVYIRKAEIPKAPKFDGDSPPARAAGRTYGDIGPIRCQGRVRMAPLLQGRRGGAFCWGCRVVGSISVIDMALITWP